jgi:hypothetical protein
MMARTILAVTLTVIIASTTHAAEADAKKAMIMLTHWQCYTWASMHDNTAAVERHFVAGLEAGNVFMDAAIAGMITPEEARANVPVMVSLTMQGPTKDFILGRLFESIQGDAYDEITAENEIGLPLNPADYITDDELIDVKARLCGQSV